MTLLTERHKYVNAFPNCLQGQEEQSNGQVASLPLSLAHLDRWLMHMACRQHRARQYAETRHWHTTDKISGTKWQASQRLWLARGRPTWGDGSSWVWLPCFRKQAPTLAEDKKTKTSTTVKLILSFIPFISLSYTCTIIGFVAVGKNWFPNHLSLLYYAKGIGTLFSQ